MYLYHATDKRNEKGIIANGLLPSGEGITYFSESEEESIKFIYPRVQAMNGKQIIVIRVQKSKLNEKYLGEGIDHDSNHFKAKVYTYSEPLFIPLIDKCSEWEIKREV